MSKHEFILRAMRIIKAKLDEDIQSRANVERVALQICDVIDANELSTLECMAITAVIMEAVWDRAYQSFCRGEQQQAPVLQ